MELTLQFVLTSCVGAMLDIELAMQDSDGLAVDLTLYDVNSRIKLFDDSTYIDGVFTDGKIRFNLAGAVAGKYIGDIKIGSNYFGKFGVTVHDSITP